MKTPHPANEFVDSVLLVAERMHARAGSRHHVASPLGAWLLLAVASTATDAAERAACERALGMDRDVAAVWARKLLDTPHPAVASALALWVRARLRTSAMDAWRASLGPGVETGELPSQAGADAWAKRVSLGLIARFPLRVKDSDVVLSTALATRCRWLECYALAPGRVLAEPGDGAGTSWGAGLRRVLRSVNDSAGSIIRTNDIGAVIVHRRDTHEGLRLTSVRALPDLSPDRVLKAAYAIATGTEIGPSAEVASAFDLPLGAHPLWEIAEWKMTASGREELYDVRLPCWKAMSSHDLRAPTGGFDAVGASILRLLGLPKIRVQCAQAATAQYSRAGFEAAAVSSGGFLGRSLMSESQEGLRRTVTLRFNRPYAVVAVATGSADETVADDWPISGASLWHGVPVFAAWVAEPSDSEVDDVD